MLIWTNMDYMGFYGPAGRPAAAAQKSPRNYEMQRKCMCKQLYLMPGMGNLLQWCWHSNSKLKNRNAKRHKSLVSTELPAMPWCIIATWFAWITFQDHSYCRKLKLRMMGDLEHLRTTAQDRNTWDKLIRRVRKAGQKEAAVAVTAQDP